MLVSFPSPSLRLLIIGGSGFLSGTLTRIALAQGHSVTIVTRGERPVPDGVRALRADRLDRAAFARCIAETETSWDLVVDAIPYTADDARQDAQVFSGLTERFVFVSTDFVYHPHHRTNPQPERVATYATEGYGARKREAELILEDTPPSELPWTILRPGHIYGPGSFLGCLPLHGRDPNLIDHLREGRPLRLVGGGQFLQQPIFALDLAETILSAAADPASIGRILNVAGPDVVESRVYYQILGTLLDREVTIEDESTSAFLEAHPELAPFCCDRVYDLALLRATGLRLPATTLESGLRQSIEKF